MRFVSILLCFLCSTFSISAQDAVIAVEKMNIFYIGLDNLVSIAMPNVPSEELKVTISENATIIKTNQEGYYVVNVIRPGQVSIKVSSKSKTTEKHFRVKKIPDPKVSLGIRERDEVDLNKFKATNGIIAEILNFDIDARCLVQSYTATILMKGGDVRQFRVEGGAYSKELRNEIEKLQIGDKIVFKDIKSRCPGDSVSRDLESISFVMK